MKQNIGIINKRLRHKYMSSQLINSRFIFFAQTFLFNLKNNYEPRINVNLLPSNLAKFLIIWNFKWFSGYFETGNDWLIIPSNSSFTNYRHKSFWWKDLQLYYLYLRLAPSQLWHCLIIHYMEIILSVPWLTNIHTGSHR